MPITKVQNHPAEEAVVTKAELRAAERLGLTARLTAATIGVSEATFSRLRTGTAVLEVGSKPFELAVLLVRLFRSLDAIVGGDEKVARAWMKSGNLVLGGAPAEKIRSVTGLVDVISYLDARRALV